jgi:hypothetical protein
LCHPAVAAVAVMRARVLGLCNALVLRNAPATEREFNVLRTALAFKFALGVACSLLLSGAVWPMDPFEGLRTVRDRLPREADRGAARDIAGLALK